MSLHVISKENNTSHLPARSQPEHYLCLSAWVICVQASGSRGKLSRFQGEPVGLFYILKDVLIHCLRKEENVL